MAKYAGLVGFAISKETAPGIYTPTITERPMRGDVIYAIVRNVENEFAVSKDVKLNHRVSLVGDKFSFANFANIRWVEWGGEKWEVTAVEIQKPRLLVNFGGIYNES